MSDLTKKATDVFLREFQKRNSVLSTQNKTQQKIIDDKNIILIPVRQLLKRFVDASIYVDHAARYDPSSLNKNFSPQLFTVWEGPSSPTWAPGHSIYFDHPASVEIAIANPGMKEQGHYIVSCVTENPNAHLLRGPFSTPEEVCVALAKFLSVSTIRIERPEALED